MASSTRKEDSNHLTHTKGKSKLGMSRYVFVCRGIDVCVGQGPLDLDSSPAIVRVIDNGSPARSERQTTPSEWPSSPRPVEEWPISPPSTPPLFTSGQTQEVSNQSARVPGPVAHSNAREVTTIVQQALSKNPRSTLKTLTPAQGRVRSLPPHSLSSTYSSALSTTNLRSKATSLPLDILRSSVSNIRKVPPPLVKAGKEACGEVLVPCSDSGGSGTQSSFHRAGSTPNRLRATIAAAPGHDPSSLGVCSSQEHINDMHVGRNLNPDRERLQSQDLDGMELDDFHSVAVNGSYSEAVHGGGTPTRNEDATNKGEAVRSSLASPRPEVSHEQPPPSSPPIHSQSPSSLRSASLVEEMVVIEGRATPPHLPTVIGKRARSLSQSPPQSKRPRLTSPEPVSPNHQEYDAAARKVFDPELLKIGIEVDLRDYDNNPPPYPWGEGLSRLDLKPPLHPPLLITNSKLAEIWTSVCKSRGWYKE
jgi:hypothetical protein